MRRTKRVGVRGGSPASFASLLRAVWTEFRLRSGGSDYALRHARRLGVRVGPDAVLYRGVSWGTEPWLIEIGARTWITGGVTFFTHDGSHEVLPHDPDIVLNAYGRIIVGDDCFIGQRAIILRGIRIGDGCVIGAGSVITRSVPPGHVAAGNPARVICTTKDYAARVASESLPLPARWDTVTAWRQALESTVPYPPGFEE